MKNAPALGLACATLLFANGCKEPAKPTPDHTQAHAAETSAAVKKTMGPGGAVPPEEESLLALENYWQGYEADIDGLMLELPHDMNLVLTLLSLGSENEAAFQEHGAQGLADPARISTPFTSVTPMPGGPADNRTLRFKLGILPHHLEHMTAEDIEQMEKLIGQKEQKFNDFMKDLITKLEKEMSEDQNR